VIGHSRQLLFAAFVFVSAAAVLALSGCGGADTAVETSAATEADASLASAEAPADVPDHEEPPSPARWPRPIPPELYRTTAVETPGALSGTVTAAVDGHGVLFDTPVDPACPNEPFRVAAGPLSGAVLSLEGITEGVALAPRDATASLGGCAIAPRVQLATVGSSVRASSSDGQAHTLQLVLWDGYRDLGSLVLPADGTEVERRLRLPGLVHLRCDDHPASRGWMWVMEHPYHALTEPDGTFRINDIPPGRYVLHVWHEAHELLIREVDVTADGGLPLDLVLTHTS